MHMVVHLLAQKSSQNNSIKGELRRHSVLHLKVHLRFYFKKHKKLQKTVKKKMHLTLQLMVHLTMQSRVPLWISLRILYILYRPEQNCWHSEIRFRISRSQVFTAVHRKRLIHEFPKLRAYVSYVPICALRT